MTLSNALAWSFDAIAGINWLEAIKALAPVATAFIAFFALRNWQRQDKAKREADFLDALIEATHAYVVEMPTPITILEMAKIGIVSHAPTWETGDEEDIAVKGAIAYIQKYGKETSERLLEVLGTAQLSVIKLRSLAAKGQIFKFAGYAKCGNAVAMLTWQFDRIQAFAAFIGSSTWYWQNPRVLKRLKDMIAIDPEEVHKSLREQNVALIEFTSETYARIYGQVSRRNFFWKARRRRRDARNT